MKIHSITRGGKTQAAGNVVRHGAKPSRTINRTEQSRKIEDAVKLLFETPSAYPELKAQYEADVKAAGGENCRGCTLNAIRAKYVAKIRRALKNKPNDT